MNDKIPKTILVIQTAFLGDLILTTGILEKLHQKYPNAQIDLLIKKGYAKLFDAHPFVHKILQFDKKNKRKEIPRLVKQIKNAAYDLLINTHRHLSSGILAATSKAKLVIGYRANPLSTFYQQQIPYHIDDGRHEYLRLHDLIRHITDEHAAKPKLYVDRFGDPSISEAYICIAPGSVWQTKRWPISAWIDFLKTKPKQKVYLLGGKTDFDDNQKILTALPRHPIINTAGKMHILSSIYLMKHAQMNYVMDSAPLHMASAVNAAVTALFLSTTPKYGFYPLSDHSIIVQTPLQLDCRPCGSHGHKTCPQGHFKCAQLPL